jgi:hypothetical protein
MRSICLLFLVMIIAAFSGCAHQIAITPDIARIESDASLNRIEKNVGFYIAPDLREKVVTTPGGGGDSVSYFPYKDIETGFYKMLSNVFQDVTPLKSAQDTDTIKRKTIAYIITPEITTASSSPSGFTWPPTFFSVTLACLITDPEGRAIVRPSVTGEGLAEYDEFKTDFSLSGKRASREALLKMQDTLLRLPELRNP